MKLNKKQVREYLAFPNHCPFCKGTNLEGERVEIDDQYASQCIDCADCGAQWYDVYTLTNIELHAGPTKTLKPEGKQ